MMSSLLLFIFCFTICRICCEILIYDKNTAGSTIISCDASNNCANNEIYFAGSSLVVTCNGHNKCNNLKIYCGAFDPPGNEYSISDMNGPLSSTNCQINQGSSTYSNSNIYMYCNGNNVNQCVFHHTMNGITSSTLECNVKSLNAGCYYSCPLANYCAASNNLICHDGSACSCISAAYCGNIKSEAYTTAPPTTTTSTTTDNPSTVSPTTNNPTTSIPTTTNNPTIAPTQATIYESTSYLSSTTTNDPTTSTVATISGDRYNFSFAISIIAVNITNVVIVDAFNDVINGYLKSLSINSNYSLDVDIINNDNILSVNIIISTNDSLIYDQIDKTKLIAFIDDNLNEKQIDIIYSITTTTDITTPYIDDNRTKNNDNNNNGDVAIIITVILILLLIVVGILIFYYRRYWKYGVKKPIFKINRSKEMEINTDNMSTNMVNIKAETTCNVHDDQMLIDEDNWSNIDDVNSIDNDAVIGESMRDTISGNIDGDDDDEFIIDGDDGIDIITPGTIDNDGELTSNQDEMGELDEDELDVINGINKTVIGDDDDMVIEDQINDTNRPQNDDDYDEDEEEEEDDLEDFITIQ